MIHLEKINSDNLWKILELSVRENQRSFVATNTESILETYLAITEGHPALPFGIYDGDTPVGFVMFSFGSDGSEGEPSVAAGNYVLWRFMIDQTQQGKGYGRAGMQAALDYLATMPCGKAEQCWLFYEPENTVAARLYRSFGFIENGEVCGGEIVAVRKL